MAAEPEQIPLWKKLLPADLGGKGNIDHPSRGRGPPQGIPLTASNQAHPLQMDSAQQREIRSSAGYGVPQNRVAQVNARADQAVTAQAEAMDAKLEQWMRSCCLQ
mmetsp:Transcript_8415/g.15375  ORF Transcript_8415/g.15375 Transcript_8415/m.15375 type:complete len:105 (+) Transcript_8415:76-390(+)